MALFEWAKYNESRWPILRWMFAIPNGTRTSIHVAAKMKASGVKRGVADIMLPYAQPGGACGLFIEMKTAKGHLSPEQKEFLEAMTAQGYATAVCHGLDEAIKVITEYLEADE